MPEYDDDPDDDASRAVQRAVVAARIREQQSWMDLQLKRAVERGDLGGVPREQDELDPEWWADRLAAWERDAVLPPSLALLHEEANLDDRLDDLDAERDVRRVVVDFNERVIRARGQDSDDPIPVALPRDIEAAVEAWHERRTPRRVPRSEPASHPRRRHWWNRRTRGEGDT